MSVHNIALVFPAEFDFYSDDQASFKQILTIFNPFDFPINFKILSTSPKAYIVRPAKGIIKPRLSADIVIRLKEFGDMRKDKFMVKVTDDQERELNSKTIVANLRWGSNPSAASAVPVSSAPKSPGRKKADDPVAAAKRPLRSWQKNIFFLLILGVLAGLVIVIDPGWIAISTNFFSLSTAQQLIFAFLLGMMAMVFLRTIL